MANNYLQSKDIFIMEGDTVTRVDDVFALLTVLSQGGAVKWVPMDSVKLATKRITRPGKYVAKNEPGHPMAYSEVAVVKEDGSEAYKVGIKAITENGTYIAAEETGYPFYVYTMVVVNVPGV